MNNRKFVCNVVLALLLLLPLLSRVAGQSQLDTLPPPPPPPKPKPKPTPPPPKDDDFDVVRVSSNLVIVPVSVTDSTGQPTLGLSAADFHLQEQGRNQEIAQIGDPEQVPLEIALLLDVSGSVDASLILSVSRPRAFSSRC